MATTPPPGSTGHAPDPVPPTAADLHPDDVDDRSTDRREAWLDQIEPADLRRMLASQPVIEQAKGVLMGRYACSATSAFTILTRLSSTTHTRVRDVAAVVVGIATERAPASPTTPETLVDDVTRHLVNRSGGGPGLR